MEGAWDGKAESPADLPVRLLAGQHRIKALLEVFAKQEKVSRPQDYVLFLPLTQHFPLVLQTPEVQVELYSSLTLQEWDSLSWASDAKEVAFARTFKDLLQFLSKKSASLCVALGQP